MKQDEIFQLLGTLVALFVILYVVVRLFKVQMNVVEGLTSSSGSGTGTGSNGEAGNAAAYAETIKAQVVKMQDELLIDKYRGEYEKVLIQLDDYVGMLMIRQCLNLKLDDAKEGLAHLSTLQNAKQCLNTTMAFLDKQ